jgi:hypothetical protein
MLENLVKKYAKSADIAPIKHAELHSKITSLEENKNAYFLHFRLLWSQ